MRQLLAILLALPLAACAGARKPVDVSTPQAPPPAGVSPSVPPAPAPQPPSGPIESRPLATLSGTVTYRLRIALTPEAVVQVELRDVSRQDVEAPLIAKRVMERPGQVPIPFSLEYDPSLIEPGHVYAVSARISDRGQLQFVTDTRVPVITGGAPTSVEVVVVPVR